MKVVSSSEYGRDSVELYFDPEGRESVADHLVREGYFVAHSDSKATPHVPADAGTKTADFGESGFGSD